MKDIIIGFSLMFLIPSCVLFWIYFIQLHETKQINLNLIPYYKKTDKFLISFLQSRKGDNNEKE